MLLASAGIYDQDFIAANQEERADNIIKGSKADQVKAIRQHIQEFKQANQVDKIVVLWTANTERYAQVSEGRALRSLSAAPAVQTWAGTPTDLSGKASAPPGVLGP